MKFSDLGLAAPIQRALAERGHTVPTPIQSQAIPRLLEGRDMLGIAQTGTGKTAAFALPILHHLAENPIRPEAAEAAPADGGRGDGGRGDWDARRDDRREGGRHEKGRRGTGRNGKTGHRKGGRPARSPRALILAPTRELAIQIAEEFRAYGKFLQLRQTVIFGGVGQRPQVDSLSRGTDIVIATPGRLLDLMSQRHCDLSRIEFLVLDEADRMLDMGFVRDVRKILAQVPAERQSLLFSATMPADVARLSAEILTDPVRVEVTPQSTPVERIAQSVHHVETRAKPSTLTHILGDPALARVIVFARTKHRADVVTRNLGQDGVAAEAIHGNKAQNARQRALKRFRAGEIRVLVATDIAARGIDVEGVTHVVNYDLPNVPESYVHRIGRTARAGAGGKAISFCDAEERAYLRDIERLTGVALTVIGDAPPAEVQQPRGKGKPGGRGKGRPNGRPHRRSNDRFGDGSNDGFQGRSKGGPGRGHQDASDDRRGGQDGQHRSRNGGKPFGKKDGQRGGQKDGQRHGGDAGFREDRRDDRRDDRGEDRRGGHAGAGQRMSHKADGGPAGHKPSGPKPAGSKPAGSKPPKHKHRRPGLNRNRRAANDAGSGSGTGPRDKRAA